MVGASCETDAELIGLRQQANYWRAQHARAVEREAAWKEEARKLAKIVREQRTLIWELTGQLETVKARVALLARQVFGRRSEATKGRAKRAGDSEANVDEGNTAHASETSPADARRRGKQPGAKGYGRRRRTNLPAVDVPHDLKEAEKSCPVCERPFAVFPGTEDSEEVDWEVRLFRRVHKRARYVPTCNCRAVSGIVTAPCPPKLIPKGMFSVGFWVRLLMEKFLFQRPLHRVREMLRLEGLPVSQVTLTGGMKRLGELLQPVYALILERNRTAKHWHMDETRWMVFAELEGKVGHKWWLWVSVTRKTCAYILDPSRSAKVPKEHLGEDAEGIISADRYSAYKALLGGKVRIAFCWGHVRRDFDRIRDGYRRFRPWAEGWMARINDLFAQNARRLAVRSDAEAFRTEDQKLRKAVAEMAQLRDGELVGADLHPAQRKALKSMLNHWEGLTLFVDNPDIPMDNNEAERRLRNPVVGRKNYYGSGAIWSGMLAAMLFTIFQTLLLNGLSPLEWLQAYFEACALAGGRAPEDVEAFRPWYLSEEHKAAWRYPEPCERGPP